MTDPLRHKPSPQVVAAQSVQVERAARARREAGVEEPLDALPAQRIWVLERRRAPRPDDDVCGYAGAVLLLGSEHVYGLIVRSPESARASDIPLREGRLRVRLDRDAFKFLTLDDALDGMARIKQMLLARGWGETND